MKNNKDNKSFEKAKSLSLSIIISIILWVAIINIVNPDVTTTINNIPIQTNGISSLREKGLVMVNADKLPTCSVKIRGKRGDIIESKDRIYAVINVSDITAEGTVDVSVNINSPASVNLEKQSISKIRAEIETRYEKDIPVSIKQTGDPENILIKTEPKKQEVRVFGSKKDLDKIHGCLVTADVSEITSDVNVMYSFSYLSDKGEQIQKPETVYSADTNLLLSHTVYEKKTTKPQVTIPKELDKYFRTNIDESVFNEKTVSYGVRSEMAPLEKIDFTFDVSQLTNGENKLALTAPAIDGVYIPENQLVLNFTAEKLFTKKVTVEIIPENLDAAFSASVISSDEFVLTGTEKELENAEAMIDLKGATEGTHQYSVKFKDKNLQPEKNYYATVVIIRKEE